MVAGIVPALGMTPQSGPTASGKTTRWPLPRQNDPQDPHNPFLNKKPTKR